MTGARDAQRELRALASAKRAAVMKGYFRTGAGEYGEGDEFLGVSVPDIRDVARRNRDLALPEVSKLLDSPLHEDRLFAVILLAERAKRADDAERLRLFRFYVAKRRRVNNWDLVDVSAPYVVGPLLDGPARAVVERLSRSVRLWDRRVAVVSHQHEIRAGRVAPFLRFAPRFLAGAGGGKASAAPRGRRGVLVGEEDLIHKAVGWMLRECGDRDAAALRRFLDRYAARMPRTMLRYAIEKLPAARRGAYLRKRQEEDEGRRAPTGPR